MKINGFDFSEKNPGLQEWREKMKESICNPRVDHLYTCIGNVYVLYYCQDTGKRLWHRLRATEVLRLYKEYFSNTDYETFLKEVHGMSMHNLDREHVPKTNPPRFKLNCQDE